MSFGRERPMSDDDLVHVPPDDYLLTYTNHQTRRIFHQWKLYLTFAIADDGEHAGKELTRYYNIKFVGRNENQRINAGWYSDLMREFVFLFDEKPRRPDEIPLTRFNNRTILGRVESVTKDQFGNPIPKPLHYSRIMKLIEVID